MSAAGCCNNFDENHNSLNIQNGGLKIEIKTIKYKTRRKYGPISMNISGYLYLIFIDLDNDFDLEYDLYLDTHPISLI